MTLRKFSAEVHQAFAAVQRALDELFAVPSPEETVLVACSGGADSLALAVATAQAAKRVGRTTRKKGRPIRAGAVIIDHGLQDGSAAAAQKTATQCQALGLDPVQTWDISVPQTGQGLEAAAREARYAAFAEAALETGARAVLLGHTLDDQAESVLLGLARGSGARSLAGMPRIRPLDTTDSEASETSSRHPAAPSVEEPRSGVSKPRGSQDLLSLTMEPGRKTKGYEALILRPFLEVSRETTEQICALFGLEPWFDPTNSPSYDGKHPKRNRIRNEALPVLEQAAGPGIKQNLARTAALLREDADALDFYALQCLADAKHAASLDIATLEEAPSAVRNRVLRMFLVENGVPPTAATRALVASISALIDDWRGQGGVYLPGNAVIRRVCGTLSLEVAQNK